MYLASALLGQMHILRLLMHINQKLETIMAIEDDLLAAVQKLGDTLGILTANVSANDVAIQAELSALSTSVAAAKPAGNTAAIQMSIDNISKLSGTAAAAAAAIASETQALSKSLPAPAPAPAPAPTA